ncbi:GDYXXLXY domain-containing protein [Sphingobacterium lactis]|uniref:Uncharacterized membrane-anchored protein n=1 Tax=Sphingobacterium lactis TaxID=797291 RepID=A0A1H6CPW1_9SPHI|nr:GDYXXLXY domain-containing protein [Sphingobacterium lactis]SEG75021.1 Uncharacterized membrane-anchored protein [Sphingobacterium lactis]
MKKLSIIFIVINLIALLGYFNYSIVQKEKLLHQGKLVFLEIAPVDPRSLMQGDYMRLDYTVGQQLPLDDLPRRGFMVVELDKNQVGKRIRFQKETTPLHRGEYLINYSRPQNWRINIGAESFFFEEGTGERYEAAKYSAIRVDDQGNSLLVGLYDKDLKELK